MSIKKKVNREKYVFENKSNESLMKLPGDLNGSTFQIDNLKNCEVKIFDYSSQILIDDCTDCIFIIGPVKNNIYLRNCFSCKIAVVCSQFRIEKSKGLKIKLFSLTDPAIEFSEDLEFGPYNVYYPFLYKQIKQAELKIDLNYYRRVYDHSPEDGKEHFRFSDFSKSQVMILPIEGLGVNEEYASTENLTLTNKLFNFQEFALNTSDNSYKIAKTKQKAKIQELEITTKNKNYIAVHIANNDFLSKEEANTNVSNVTNVINHVDKDKSISPSNEIEKPKITISASEKHQDRNLNFKDLALGKNENKKGLEIKNNESGKFLVSNKSKKFEQFDQFEKYQQEKLAPELFLIPPPLSEASRIEKKHELNLKRECHSDKALTPLRLQSKNLCLQKCNKMQLNLKPIDMLSQSHLEDQNFNINLHSYSILNNNRNEIQNHKIKRYSSVLKGNMRFIKKKKKLKEKIDYPYSKFHPKVILNPIQNELILDNSKSPKNSFSKKKRQWI